MGPNKLTAGANVMWESSRMMLPQHKEASLLRDKQRLKITRPELTEEAQEELFGRLKASLVNTIEVSVTLYGEYENRQLTGVITGLDPRQRLVKLEPKRGDWVLFQFDDVLRVEF